ncbi:MAG TPA: twin-arginine translocase TatA/TatE family subunit [Balneolales bacterium]|nr:twin-arginine translocase TatA/TatE family subunit [Balneolales bacterium]
MFDFGGLEWLVIILIVVLLFGAKKIPELAKGLGQGINEFRKASEDIKKEINEGAQSSAAPDNNDQRKTETQSNSKS